MARASAPAVAERELSARFAEADLHVRVFRDGDGYTAVADALHVASGGDSPEAARRSLQEALAEYLEFLEEKNVTLGPELHRQLEILRGATL